MKNLRLNEEEPSFFNNRAEILNSVSSPKKEQDRSRLSPLADSKIDDEDLLPRRYFESNSQLPQAGRAGLGLVFSSKPVAKTRL